MRRPKEKKIRPDKYCEYCGRRISPGRSGRRKFCSNACKQAAYRLRLGVTAGISESNEESR
jgi:hypothetical protein